MNELTREQILSMPASKAHEPSVLDQLVAIHVMGWEVRKYYVNDDSYHEHYVVDGKKYENVNYPDEWQPSRYIDKAYEVEAQIDKMGSSKREDYVSALKSILLLFSTREYVEKFDYIHATPEHRCKAALLAVMGL